MIELLESLDIKKAVEIGGTIGASIITILKIPNLLPKTRNRLMKDLELLEKASNSGINVDVIKSNLQFEIDKMYTKTFKIYNWNTFISGVLSLILFSFLSYLQYNTQPTDSRMFWLVMFVFGSIAVIFDSFSKPLKKEDSELQETTIEGEKKNSKPVIALYSIWSLVIGVFTLLFFLIWMYFLNFKDGVFEFSLATFFILLPCFFSISLILYAFKKN